ncbi:MAG: tetratricopeptide repeat-containing protein [Rhodobacteraceae bacterium]|nr:tetratricopeptide repeat-containing protein [Paracoccaceae bacterium]
MSRPPISESERRSRQWRAARNAGWKRSELVWEEWQEKGNELLSSGRSLPAALRFIAADWLAMFTLDRLDPRRAASTANAACALRMIGAGWAARRFYALAIRDWGRIDRQLRDVVIQPRARSSLFHLRMEALHRERFEANRRQRLSAFIDETGECLEHIAGGLKPPHRLYARWNGEKPPVFDDSRRLLAACLLVAFPD